MTRKVDAGSLPVVIVGGGPVGVTLSIALANLGLESVVIERDVGIHPLPRAILIDAECHRSLIHQGLESALEGLLTPMRTAEYVDIDGNRLAGQDLDGVRVHGGLAPSSVHYQPEIEAMLRAESRRRGVTLREGNAVVDIDIDGDGGGPVSVTLADGSTLEGRWLVACDGASSTVRRRLGIEREDLGFDQDWLVVDIEVTDRATCGLPDVGRQICDPSRPTTLLSGHGRRFRWEFQIQPSEDPAQFAEEANVWRLLEPWITNDKGRLIRSAAYKFHAGVVRTMRVGPVLLAGDSAHQMPPFMGQGLNSGMRDAFNAAWKLKWVDEGWADDALLDTFSSERIEHSRATVAQSVEAGLLIDQFAGRHSHGIAAREGYGGASPRPRYTSGMVVGDHPRVGLVHPSWNQFVGSVPVGPEMVLLSTGHAPAPRWRGPWSTRTVGADMTFGADHAVVRPDGIVAAVTDSGRLAATLERLRDVMTSR